jgi:hypothetical protein
MCFFHHDESIKHLFFKFRFARSIWSVIQLALTLYQPRGVANIFGNWLNSVDDRFKNYIRVGAIDIIWSSWLCRNDKVFNNKNTSLLHIIYRCARTLRLWSSLQRVKNRDLFMEICSWLEGTTRKTFSQYRLQHNMRIGPLPSWAILKFLTMICNLVF